MANYYETSYMLKLKDEYLNGKESLSNLLYEYYLRGKQIGEQEAESKLRD